MFYGELKVLEELLGHHMAPILEEFVNGRSYRQTSRTFSRRNSVEILRREAGALHRVNGRYLPCAFS